MVLRTRAASRPPRLPSQVSSRFTATTATFASIEPLHGHHGYLRKYRAASWPPRHTRRRHPTPYQAAPVSQIYKLFHVSSAEKKDKLSFCRVADLQAVPRVVEPRPQPHHHGHGLPPPVSPPPRTHTHTHTSRLPRDSERAPRRRDSERAPAQERLGKGARTGKTRKGRPHRRDSERAPAQERLGKGARAWPWGQA